MISLKDIAKKVGVAPSTVSFVLNGKDKEMRISPKTAEKIKAIAKKEGYHPNQVAVSLRTGKSRTIGLMVDTISGSFFASLARVIEQEADNFGYKIIYCSTGNDVKKGKEQIRTLHQSHVDGYLIIPTEGMEDDINELVAIKKPVVLIDSYFAGTTAPYVLVDNFSGVAKGISHLIGKGYRKIGFVCNDIPLIQMKERIQGYSQTLKEKGIPTSKRLILKTKYNGAREDIIQQIATYINTVKPKAIMFAANYLGVYGLETIKQLHLKIPDDIAVVCFDDHEIFSLYSPGITSIQQPVEEIARTAIHILMGELKIKKKARMKQLALKATMIERSST